MEEVGIDCGCRRRGVEVVVVVRVRFGVVGIIDDGWGLAKPGEVVVVVVAFMHDGVLC